MAFATANLKQDYAGGHQVLYGKWTGSAGDAAGTVTVKGGRVYLAEFLTNNSTNPGDKPNVRWSGSGNTITVTVENRIAVTDGSFKIEYI